MSASRGLCIVLMGVSGCGKSTVAAALARRLALPFIEGDSLHPPRNVALMAAGTPLTDDDRRDWLSALATALAQAETTGAVLSCSALRRSYRDRLRCGAPALRLVHLSGDEALLNQRLQARSGHYMPASLLRSQLDTLEPPSADEGALTLDISAIAAAAGGQHLPAPGTGGVMNDAFSLRGKLALITGSSAGIGLALARGLGQAGATVVLNGRDPQRLAAARQQLAAEGLVVHERSFDVCEAAEVEAAVADIEAQVGAIDILINNAGITRRGAFHEMPAADWQSILRTNIDSVFIVGQVVARRMVARGRGRIINTCSVMSELGRPGTAAYTASKGAVKMLTKGMAIDLGPHGINVNGIGPGYFKTELTAALARDEKFNAWLINHTPSRRWGEVAELAGAAVFLASDASSFVNGHILYVDGGVSATL